MAHRKRAAADDGELLTSDEVIDVLLADETLRRAASCCVLPAVRRGREWRFRRRDLDEWIRRQRPARRADEFVPE
jgi:excisionase family DNA binding protein